MEPLISVIIPAYNACLTLQRCLDSVFRQTYPNIQLVVVNDGSSDDTALLLEDNRRVNETMVVISQPNSGILVSREKGVEVATGEFICFVDADDYLSDDAVEKLYQGAQQYRANMVIGGFYRKTKTYTLDMTDYEQGETIDNISLVCQMLRGKTDRRNWAVLYERSFFKKTELTGVINYGEDLFVNMFFLLQTPLVIAYIKQPVYYYVQDMNSYSNTRLPLSLIKQSSQIVNDIIDRMAPNIPELEQASLLYRFVFILSYVSRSSNKSIHNDPFVKALYREICGDPDNIRLIKQEYGILNYLIFYMHRYSLTAFIGKILSRIKKTNISICKRIRYIKNKKQ